MRDSARRRACWVGLLVILSLCACGDGSGDEDPPPTPTPGPIEVLVFTRTVGFRHPSITDAIRVLSSLPAEEDILPTFTEDPAMFTDDGLASFDVILFANTTADVLDDDQQAAMERFIQSGKGFVGVHSAADTEYEWPWYGQLVGAYFVSHPILPVEVTVTTEDGTHPSTSHLPGIFQFTDEWYNFDRNPRHDNVILLTVDEAGFIFPNFPPSPSMGADHPVAWYKEFDGGRSFYTNLGHRPETWDDPRFLTHLLEGIRWAAGGVEYNRIVLTGAARNPLALAVAPDGRVLYVERGGDVRLWRPDTGRVIQALQLPVDTNFENGLLGIALDPRFRQNRFVYLYHSTPVSDPPPASGPPGENVLSRFTLGNDDRLDPASRVDLLTVPSERQCCHEGGSLAFAPDGTLFLSTGDNTDPFASMGTAPLDEQPGRERYNSQRTAANPFDLRGKILRINPDGSIPDGNLFPRSGELGRPEIYIMGARNPFRIAVDATSGRLFWGDVGPDAPADSARGPRGYDEINFADGPGNYGWPYCIGPNLPYNDIDFATGAIGAPFSCDSMVPALVAYDYLTVSYLALGNALNPEGNPALPGIALTGRTAIAGAFYATPPANARFALPGPFQNKLLMIDWTRDVIAAVDINESGTLNSLVRAVPFFRFLRPIDLDVGPDGALYVLEYGTGYYGDNDDARVSRIEYSATGALTPVAQISASATAGGAPLTVTFSATGSAPGRGEYIERYEWDIDGDGAVDGAGPTFLHTYDTTGVFGASVVAVSSARKRSFPAVIDIVVGNAPPAVTIAAPADGTHVPAGSAVMLIGSGVDPEDGNVPCNKLSWDIRLGHYAHAHPLFVRQGCAVSFPAVFTGGHSASGGTFYAVELSYTDAGGPNGEPALTGRAGIRVEVDPG